MQKAFDDLNKATDILVVGNGFDLHCGLKSSFKNFFDSELRTSIGFKSDKIKKNIWYLIFTYAFMLDTDKGGKIVPFVNNNDPLWMDVETYIDNVFKAKKNMLPQLPIYDFILNTLKVEPDESFIDSLIINGDYKNQLFQIRHRVWNLKYNYGLNTPEDILFFDLKNFEHDFTLYLKNELEKKKDNYEKEVMRFVLVTLDNYATNSLFVISFNYTNSFSSGIDIDKIDNVHGTLENENIIIGIGDYEKSGLPGRDKFKKSKRRVTGNYGKMNLPDKENVKSVMFYGCSFSKQDWSYFKMLFEYYELGSDNRIFKFFYSDYSTNQSENDNNRTKYYDSCVDVVEAYFEDKGINKKFDDLYTLGEIEFNAI